MGGVQDGCELMVEELLPWVDKRDGHLIEKVRCSFFSHFLETSQLGAVYS